MDAFDLILTIGLTARLTRFAVYDAAGEIVRRPAYAIAGRLGRRAESRVDELFACPFCIGFWIAFLAAGTWAAWGSTTAWTIVALASTASYAAGHLAATLDSDRDGSW